MTLDRKLYLLAFLITSFLLASLFAIGAVFNTRRESRINSMVDEAYGNLRDMQTFMLMTDVYGTEMGCLAAQSKLQQLDQSIWDLGVRIDRYRVATEEFQRDSFYLDQKKVFNENEFLYLLLVSQLKRNCAQNSSVVLFFYRDSHTCPKCDDQSFVLSDIKRDAEDQVLIFSFDMDLGLTTLNLLAEYYGLDAYPCLVIGEQRHCGMQDREFIVQQLCASDPAAGFC